MVNGEPSVLAFISCFLQYCDTRGPWTATTTPIKVKETGQINKYFLQAKNIQNWYNFTGKRIGCVNIFTFFTQEALFVTHLYTLNNNLD